MRMNVKRKGMLEAREERTRRRQGSGGQALPGRWQCVKTTDKGLRAKKYGNANVRSGEWRVTGGERRWAKTFRARLWRGRPADAEALTGRLRMGWSLREGHSG